MQKEMTAAAAVETVIKEKEIVMMMVIAFLEQYVGPTTVLVRAGVLPGTAALEVLFYAFIPSGDNTPWRTIVA